MTFKEFKAHFNQEIGKDKRHDGKVLMDLLQKEWQEEWYRLSTVDYYSETNIDCTYVEKLVPNTLKHLEIVWWKKQII